jgi:ATP-dependent DNA helicase RecQ
MVTPLRALQTLVLAESLSVPAGIVGADEFLLRVREAIKSSGSDGTVGTSDLAGLVRQGILRCHLALGEEPEMRVPRRQGWPDEATWKLFSCEVRPAGAQHFLIRPQRWTPQWLDSVAVEVVEAATREEVRRTPRPVPIDPIVADCTGHREYFSPGQRAAVQSAFLMPAGSTTVINLPTGAGKTLAFQVPALTWASQNGLTLVVVPTVSLAKDQENRFHALLEYQRQGRNSARNPLAYHSGLDEHSKIEIRSAIREGTQCIVFASPEAVTGPLRDALFESARRGRLRVFAIDEAHIVSQWGQQFRPEFQSLAGVRDALLAQCPSTAKFRTLLLTATLTSESYETLRYLFGANGCQVVSEAELRPEPGFLIRSDFDEHERVEHVLQAVRHLPRPLILYTTLREHAEQWHERLKASGYRRLQLVRGGDLAQDTGDDILHAWRTKRLDIIVATSAFGLGVDQADVRSVIHACLPETIDRYYQEVGRAGRDGKAAVALLVSTPEDEGTAERLTREKIISVDRGFERWEAMWVRRLSLGDDVYIVSLADRPADIVDDSEANQAWNLRILVLMARAGLIRFTAHEPPKLRRGDDEDDRQFEARSQEAFARFSREVAIQVRDPRHSDKRHWDDIVAWTRKQIRDGDSKALALVFELRDLQRPLNDIFREVYTLSEPIICPPRFAGSCPITRSTSAQNFFPTDPELTLLARTAIELTDTFQHALSPSIDDEGRWFVAYEPVIGESRGLRNWHERIFTLLRYAVSGGIAELALPDGLLTDQDWSRLSAHAPLRFLLRSRVIPNEHAMHDMAVPRLTLLDTRDGTVKNVAKIMRLNRPKHLILLPRDVLDPTRPYRRLFDVVRHLSIEEVLLRLAS